MVVAAVAFVLSIMLAAFLLVRQRERHRPEPAEPGQPPLPGRRLTRQERLLQKLEPLPEIPTLMDLMRQEITEAGIEEIPGHEGLPGPVLLKVFRRDHEVIERCPHGTYAFVLRGEVDPPEALEDDVALECEQCRQIGRQQTSDEGRETGTDQPEETL
ncbi:MAG: hypothetical protein QNJ77_11155 [Acidimicrobiia bacterium]|nr:hypothetical protein [Acidimicrobiia bacterium]